MSALFSPHISNLPTSRWRATLPSYLISAVGLLLFCATWRLWIAQDLCPQIPFFGWCTKIPGTVDLCLAFVFVIALASGLVLEPGTRWSRSMQIVFAISLSCSIMLDQHRFQPWAWQLILMALLLGTLSVQRAWFWLQLLTVGIYFHSAISKFDLPFIDDPAQWFLGALVPADWLQGWSLTTRRVVALIFPAGELAVALGLCLPGQWCRLTALFGSLIMHLLMLWILGPWGLNHQPGVLLWNLFFLVQNVILFWPAELDKEAALDALANIPDIMVAPRIGGLVSRLLVLTAVLFPFLEPWGWYDHWPSWALYATHGERVTLLVAEPIVDRLPPGLRQYTRDIQGQPGWKQVQWDRWSLASLKVPVYPQDRFLLGMSRALVEREPLQAGDFRVILESPANRWNGARTVKIFVTPEQLRAQCDRYWLNTLAR